MQKSTACAVSSPPPDRDRLYQVVQGHLEAVLAAQDEGSPGISAHAERALRRTLECGIPAHGLTRARCGDCGHDYLIAFSCKAGACASPATRVAWLRPPRISSTRQAH